LGGRKWKIWRLELEWVECRKPSPDLDRGLSEMRERTSCWRVRQRREIPSATLTITFLSLDLSTFAFHPPPLALILTLFPGQPWKGSGLHTSSIRQLTVNGQNTWQKDVGRPMMTARVGDAALSQGRNVDCCMSFISLT